MSADPATTLLRQAERNALLRANAECCASGCTAGVTRHVESEPLCEECYREMTRPAMAAAVRDLMDRGCGIPAARDHARLLLTILTREEQ